MNPPENSPAPSAPATESDAIRHDIEDTRDTIDQTIDRIGTRLKGRHLVDEVIGAFRGDGDDAGGDSGDGESTANQSKQLLNRVIESVKSNPAPAVLIGAGVAWMIYAARTKDNSSSDDNMNENDPSFDDSSSDSENSALEDKSMMGYEGGEEGGGWAGENATQGDRWPETGDGPSEPMSKAQSSSSGMMQRAGQVKDRVADEAQMVASRARQVTNRVREKATNTYQDNPVAVGAACLAAGLLIGLVLPTPRKARELAQPLANRVRRSATSAGRDMLQRGRKVVEAAAHAGAEEAKTQGFVEGDQGDGAGASPPSEQPSGNRRDNEGGSRGRPQAQGGSSEGSASPAGGNAAMERSGSTGDRGNSSGSEEPAGNRPM